MPRQRRSHQHPAQPRSPPRPRTHERTDPTRPPPGAEPPEAITIRMTDQRRHIQRRKGADNSNPLSVEVTEFKSSRHSRGSSASFAARHGELSASCVNAFSRSRTGFGRPVLVAKRQAGIERRTLMHCEPDETFLLQCEDLRIASLHFRTPPIRSSESRQGRKRTVLRTRDNVASLTSRAASVLRSR